MDNQSDKRISEELLNYLACPNDRAGLIYNEEKNTLLCSKCQKEYTIKNGIPLFIPIESSK